MYRAARGRYLPEQPHDFISLSHLHPQPIARFASFWDSRVVGAHSAAKSVTQQVTETLDSGGAPSISEGTAPWGCHFASGIRNGAQRGNLRRRANCSDAPDQQAAQVLRFRGVASARGEAHRVPRPGRQPGREPEQAHQGADWRQDYEGGQGGIIRQVHHSAQDHRGPGRRGRRILRLRQKRGPGDIRSRSANSSTTP